jgi:hypothetical protein
MQNLIWEVEELLPIKDDTSLMYIGECFSSLACFLGHQPLISIDASERPQVAGCLTCERLDKIPLGIEEAFQIFSIRGYVFRVLCVDRGALVVSTPSHQYYVIRKKADSHIVIESMKIQD